jgi:ribosomal-protein-alanine N-acetyltransferase
MTATALRPMRWWDIAPILDLEAELFAEDSWSAGLFWSELAQHESRDYFVVIDDGAIVGYGGVAVLGADAYIQTIGITKALWGTGLGSVLLAELLSRAQAGGVFGGAHTPGAPRLYERFGFKVVGIRKGYYQPSGADAHVMIRRPA